MNQKFPVVVTAGAIQNTVYAALRILGVLTGGFFAILGFVSQRDLAGLTAYVHSSDFTAVASALAAVASFAYGLWSTYWHKKALETVAENVPDSIATVKKSKAPGVMSILPFVGLIGLVMLSAGCATIRDDVRLNSNKAFLTAQIAFKSAQQSTLAVCSVPAPAIVEPCGKAIDLLHTGAQAEAAGFTAQQTGNAADLQTAVTTLTNLPAQLVALGILKAD